MGVMAKTHEEKSYANEESGAISEWVFEERGSA